MKQLKFGLLGMTLALCAFNSSANVQQKFVAANASPTTKICMAMTSNKPLKVHNVLKRNRIKKHIAVRKVQCNGESIADFAYRYGFDRTANFMSGARKGEVQIRDIAKANSVPVTVTGS